jgi:hypothetical protein
MRAVLQDDGIVILRKASARRRFCGSSRPLRIFRCGGTADPSTPARNPSAPPLRMTISILLRETRTREACSNQNYLRLPVRDLLEKRPAGNASL